MLRVYRAQLAGMSADQVRHLAARLGEETAHRGVFARLAAAGACAELIRVANEKDAQGDADVSRGGGG